MSLTYTFDSTHTLRYNIKDLYPVPDDVISSLSGLDRITGHVPGVLNRLFPQYTIGAEIYVQQVSHGSFWTDVVIRLMFGNEEAFHAWLREVRSKTKLNHMKPETAIITVAVGGLVLYGASCAMSKFHPATPSGNGNTNAIGSTVNHVQQQIENLYMVDPMQLQDAIRSAAANQYNIASNATKVFKPARRRLNVGKDTMSISLDSNNLGGGVTFDTDFIAAVPERTERYNKKLQQLALKKVEINIRALDMDAEEKGWQVVVPNYFDKRVKLELDRNVDKLKITPGKMQVADIELYYITTDEDDRIYKSVYLNALY